MVVSHLQFQYKGWHGSYLSEKVSQNLFFLVVKVLFSSTTVIIMQV